MNARSLSSLVIVVFVVLGGIFIGLRHHARRQAQIAEQDSRWRLTYQIGFEADEPNAEVRVALPSATRHCEVLSDEFTTPGLRAETRGPYALTRTSELVVSARRAGRYDFSATFELLLSPRADAGRQPPLESLTTDALSRFTRDEATIPTLSDSVRKKIQEVASEGETTSERLQAIFNYCADVSSASEGATDDAAVALESGNGSPLAWARAMAALCRAIRIPARLVTGFEVKQQANIQPRVWVEVFQQQTWVPFDPEWGFTRYLLPNFVPVRRGGDSIIRATGASNIAAKYSIERIGPPPSVLHAELPRPVQILDLTRLPLPMHEVMKILLLLPFGALITALMRNVVGIGTFGTFSPALLAMSFIYADWETGLAILIVVVAAGLMSRVLLDRLRLLTVPRLSIILTTVILCIVFAVSLLDYMWLTPGPQAVLLPMVILTMLIERFYVTTEEDGLVFSIQLAIGTVAVAVMCYLVLAWEDVGAFVLRYPEAHFFTIALFIMLGRYAGYRLTELWRFRDLVQTRETPR